MKNRSNSNSPTEIPTIPLDYQEFHVEEIQQRALEYYENMKRRRTVRDFSARHVPLDIIQNCIRTADTAPNGANQHPWQGWMGGGIGRYVREWNLRDMGDSFGQSKLYDSWGWYWDDAWE